MNVRADTGSDVMLRDEPLPLFKQLCDELVAQFTKNEQSRTIIFVSTHLLARVLSAYLCQRDCVDEIIYRQRAEGVIGE